MASELERMIAHASDDELLTALIKARGAKTTKLARSIRLMLWLRLDAEKPRTQRRRRAARNGTVAGISLDDPRLKR